MPNSDYLISEDQIRESDLLPVEETKPQTPSGPAGTAPPSAPVYDITRQFFSGSLPPQFQLDANFARARAASTRVPESALMPFGVQANPSTNAAIESTAKTTVINNTPPAVPDDDTIHINLQTGTQYTVQQSDLNKLISISNASGGTIFLPPVAGTTSVGVTNHVESPFNSGNTVVVGQVATSTYTFTAVKAVVVGDFLFIAVRNVSSHLDAVTAVQMSDGINGGWTGEFFTLDDPAVGAIALSLFWVRNTVAIPIGGTVTLTLKTTYPAAVFNPDINQFWTMTGIKTSGPANHASVLSSGSSFSSGGVSISSPTVFISVIVGNAGSISPFAPAPSQSISWNTLPASAVSVAFNWASGFSSGTVNDTYTVGAGHGLIDLLQGFNQASPTDIAQLTTDFFCYVENKGLGAFNLVSAAPIDGSGLPVTLGAGQGCLLVWDAPTASWYTMRGIGGGVDTDFYQTVQQAGTDKPQEGKLNFAAPVTVADDPGNNRSTVTVPVMVGDSGSGGTAGLVPAPGAGDAAASKFLEADGTFKIIPTMTGDSGSGGTGGLVPAPPAGSNAAGDFLSAGGTWVNPGTNPTAFNTGLAYAIAAGYALG